MQQVEKKHPAIPDYDQEIEFVDDELTPKAVKFSVEEVKQLQPRIALKILGDLSVEEHAQLLDSYQEYVPGRKETYKEGEIFQWKGKLYSAIKEHSSLKGYDPSSLAYSSLYKSFLPDDVIDRWKQPQGAHDSYKLGAKVIHKDQVWVSTAENNIWEPGVYGWKLD